jgi:histidyl-tRNA synthetase
VNNSRFQAPRGTYDVLPALADERGRLEEIAAKILGRAGYGRIETPVFEPTQLFSRTVGEATDVVQKEMYTFPDASGDSLTLRPEGTAPVVRAYLEHGMHKEPQPVKLWYLSSFFRYERPQAGRYRQFWQVGAEAIGSADPAVDAELILLLGELLEALGARDVKLVLASLGQPEARAEYREELQAYLRAHESELSDEVRARIDLNPLRAFDAKHESTQRVMANAPRLIDRLPREDLEHFAEVQDLLQEAGQAYTVDTTPVRGLDYYTRTLFEYQSGALEAAQNTLGGGGRYDNLAEQIGGPHTPGMGWAAGVERMLMASNQPPPVEPPIDIYIAYEPGHKPAALRVATDVRRAGGSARLELAGRSVKGQLKQASRSGARYVAIFGDEGVQLRDREGGEDKLVAPETVMHHIRGRM